MSNAVLYHNLFERVYCGVFISISGRIFSSLFHLIPSPYLFRSFFCVYSLRLMELVWYPNFRIQWTCSTIIYKKYNLENPIENVRIAVQWANNIGANNKEQGHLPALSVNWEHHFNEFHAHLNGSAPMDRDKSFFLFVIKMAAKSVNFFFWTIFRRRLQLCWSFLLVGNFPHLRILHTCSRARTSKQERIQLTLFRKGS